MVTTRPFFIPENPQRYAIAIVENPEKHGWWLNELESLGVNTREESQLKDFKKATETLTMDIKEMFYDEYQKAFNEKLVS